MRVFGLLGALVGSAQMGEPPAPLFHLSFDEGLRAVAAAGSGEPLAARDVDFGPGVSGEAGLMRGDALLEYSTRGNLDRKQGAVSFWFKPNWDATSEQDRWRALFSHPRPEADRVGSGALWLWFWEGRLRGDVSDPGDTYIQSFVPAREGVWHHLAFTWGEGRTPGHRMYFDGRRVGGLRDDYTPLRKGGMQGAREFESFFVGNHKGMAWEQADGWFDEFKIFSRPLSVGELAGEVNRITPLRMTLEERYIRAGGDTGISFRLENAGTEQVEKSMRYRINGPGGLDEQGEMEVRLAPGEIQSKRLGVPTREPGRFRIELLGDGNVRLGVLSAEGWIVGDNPFTEPPGETRVTELETIDVVERFESGKDFVAVGDTRVRELGGRRYLDAGEEINDRFAIRIHLPDPEAPYLIEFTYPDDRKRSMEMIAQQTDAGDTDYMLQTGVLTGDGSEVSGEFRRFASLLWPRSRDTTLIFMTAREGASAAVSSVTVSRVEGGLPAADVRPAAPVEGWTRNIALYYEDPALPYSFGASTGSMPGFQKTVHQLVAYMKWSGQNMLLYPLVWYQGRIGEAYNPRGHPPEFLELLLDEFEREELSFMATVNLHNIPLASEPPVDAATIEDGSLHETPIMIWNTGEPNPGGWHDSSPNVNPLHPETRDFVVRHIEEILDAGAESPAFKGVALHLTRHTPLWFGHLEAGYNDYNIEEFSRETGIEVPVSRTAPERGRLYSAWLMENAREAWIQWRSRRLAEFHRDLANRISSRREDLKLGIVTYAPTISELEDPRYGDAAFSRVINREAGLDPSLYADADNIILSQTLYPADYRWSEGLHFQERHPENWAAQRDRHTTAGVYALLEEAPFPWVNMHDRYFEDAIGRLKGEETHWSGGGKAKPLEAPWLEEIGWRVSTLNPPQRHFLQHYLHPLFHRDLLGFSKGGFLIGTHGVEGELVEFSKAFRALPAVPFEDMPNGTETLGARRLHHRGDTWFYVVNVSPAEDEAVFHIRGGDVDVQDVGTREIVPVENGRLHLHMKPFQLRSFKVGGERVVELE